MAAFSFGAGKRSQALAAKILKCNDAAVPCYRESETGEKYISRLEAPCLVMTRVMMMQAYFGGKAEFEQSVNMRMNYQALSSEGKVLRNDYDSVIVADDDTDKAMSLRYKVYHQESIARFSKKLGISRNDFVLRALDHYINYLSDIENGDDLA